MFTWVLLSRKANIPASVQTAFTSAPLVTGIFSAIFFKSTSFVRFILREWILRMSARASREGSGKNIFRSIRPGRRRAGSRVSSRFVAMTIYRHKQPFATRETEGREMGTGETLIFD